MNNSDAHSELYPQPAPATASQPIIRVHQLSKRFADFCAVDNLSMQIHAGQVHGFLGPNGSGKTTAIRMMCGLLSKSAGDVEVMGLSIDGHGETIRDQVGYMTQRFSLYQDMTVKENLDFIANIRGLTASQRHQRVSEVMQEYNLASFQSRLAGPLSGGQKRRLALAAAVITKPKLLLLDEPTSEVDPNTRRDMWQRFFRLAAEGTTILVSTHLMDEAERCHHLTILNEGVKVADGQTQALKQQFPHSVVIVEGDQVAAISDRLKQHENIITVAQSGLLLRVIVDSNIDEPLPMIAELLGPDYQLRLAAVSIEDVFVAATLKGHNDA
ncbi:MAG: ABC transporter ATP-binding protein [Pseudomonadales bacterium]|nr:ABC transporter ATP-binding protein [Pseudomonadales bacterium]